MNDIILILSIWRITSIITNEDGPFHWIEEIRDFFGGPFKCFWCMSIWISLLFNICLHGGLVIDTLYYSAGAILFEEVISRLQK